MNLFWKIRNMDFNIYRLLESENCNEIKSNISMHEINTNSINIEGNLKFFIGKVGAQTAL